MDHFNETETLFLAGIKPALLLNIERKNYHFFSKEFPFSTFTYKSSVATGIFVTVAVFFQTIKEKILFDAQRLFCTKKGFDSLLGRTLGFPPKSVKLFLSKNECEDDSYIGIDFHGISFFTHFAIIQEEIEWLNKNYTIPKKLQSGIFIGGDHPLLPNEFQIFSLENIQNQIIIEAKKQTNKEIIIK